MSHHFESGHNIRASHKPLSIGTYAIFLVSLVIVTATVSSMVTKKRLARQTSSSEIALLDPSNPKSEFYQAYQQSFGFLDDIPNKSWKLMKERVRNQENHLFPDDPMKETLLAFRWYQDNWEPDFSCQHERRIGGMGDGPKWVCNPHRIAQISRTRKCLIYSVGSEGDFTFETGLYQALGGKAASSKTKHQSSGCEIHVFDPKDYSSSIPEEIESMIHFHPWGIVDEASVSTNFKTLQETVDILGHSGRIVDIFKIDCEHCEWKTYKDWLSVDLDLRQILVEVHGTPSNVNDFFETLQNENYVTFHKEPNTKYSIGNCLEYAFLKLDPSFFD